MDCYIIVSNVWYCTVNQLIALEMLVLVSSHNIVWNVNLCCYIISRCNLWVVSIALPLTLYVNGINILQLQCRSLYLPRYKLQDKHV